MRKNKKAMLVLLSAAMLAGAVSGCSKSSKTEGSIEFTEAASTEASTDWFLKPINLHQLLLFHTDQEMFRDSVYLLPE